MSQLKHRANLLCCKCFRHSSPAVISPNVFPHLPDEFSQWYTTLLNFAMLHVSMQVKGLTKVFPARTTGGSAHVAVKNLSFGMQRDSVTVLLGQNGAGKSTTMNMICGLFGPTAGSIVIGGKDMSKSENRDLRRKMIGVCPQHDVLWDTM